MELFVFSQPQTGNWLVDIISWLIKISSSIALGVILFTVLLKLITLPFDFVSRASMRKNSLKMEEMRPELEKLQKQYANDKELYNQKMMALYKKNGYSMWGSCLPTIITLVIFIVAINAFTNYSKFANQQYLYNMTKAYNGVVYSGLEVDDNYILKNQDGTITVNTEKISLADNQDIDNDDRLGFVEINADTHSIFASLNSDGSVYQVYTTNSFVKYLPGQPLVKRFELADNYKNALAFTKNASGEMVNPLACAENNYLVNSSNQTFEEYYAAEFDKFIASVDTTDSNALALKEKEFVTSFLTDIRQIKSAESFRAEKTKFLWVKNVWVTDSPMKSPIYKNWSDFETQYLGKAKVEKLSSSQYLSLISKLDKEQNEPNGYFILVALTALSSLFMQLVTSKSQKAQMELQTVDGQGAQTNKLMMWMMPVMMAVFAFMYTAAFSIYIVISSLLSMGTTALINFVVDKKYKKKDTNTQVVRGRVHDEKPEEPKKPVKKGLFFKKEEEEKPDFLTSKKPRGRIK